MEMDCCLLLWVLFVKYHIHMRTYPIESILIMNCMFWFDRTMAREEWHLMHDVRS